MVGLDSLEQVRGSAIEAFFFPEDRAFVMGDLVPRIIREGQAKAEIRFRHFVTGEPIWTLFTAFAVADASGELVALATVSRDVTEERRAHQALAESEARLAAELAVMKRLQELSTRLVKHGDGAGLLPEIVDAAIAITAADMGNVQLYDRASDSLRIVASRGFRPEDLESFAVIRRGESTCGTALERGERVVVGDVTASPIFDGKPILDAVLAAGIRAAPVDPPDQPVGPARRHAVHPLPLPAIPRRAGPAHPRPRWPARPPTGSSGRRPRRPCGRARPASATWPTTPR